MQCKPLVNKITAKITSSMAKSLSYAGRLQLIKAVLYEIQAYWAQLFLLPRKIMKMIEAACRSYIWTREVTISKRALVAWNTVCQPRRAEGLNLLNLKAWNQAAICELLWALSMKKEKLWITWVHTYYIKKQDVHTMPIPTQAAWMIKKIITMREIRTTLGDTTKLVHGGKFMISKAYTQIRGDMPTVDWKELVCHSCAEPKQIFILWLQLHDRVRTKDNQLKWRSLSQLSVFYAQ